MFQPVKTGIYSRFAIAPNRLVNVIQLFVDRLEFVLAVFRNLVLIVLAHFYFFTKSLYD